MSISDQSHILSFVSDAHARLDAATTPQPDQPGASARSLRAALPPLITVAQTIWLPGLIDSLNTAQAALDALRRQSLDADPLADAFATEIRSGLDQTLDLIAAGNLAAAIPETLSNELRDLVRAAGGFLPPSVASRPAPVKRFTAEDMVPKPVEPPADLAMPEVDPAAQTTDAPDIQNVQGDTTAADVPGSAQEPAAAEPAPLSWEVHPEEYFAEADALPAEVIETPESIERAAPAATADATIIASDDAIEPSPDISAASPLAQSDLVPLPDGADTQIQRSHLSGPIETTTPWAETSPIEVEPTGSFEAQTSPVPDAASPSSADSAAPTGLDALADLHDKVGHLLEEFAATHAASAVEPSPETDLISTSGWSESAAGQPAATDIAAATPDESIPPASQTAAEAPASLLAFGDLHDKIGRLLAEFAATHPVPTLPPEEDTDLASAGEAAESRGDAPESSEAPAESDGQKRLAALGELHEQVGQLLAEFAATHPAAPAAAQAESVTTAPVSAAIPRAEVASDPWDIGTEPAAEPVASIPTAEPESDPWDVGPEPTFAPTTSAPAADVSNNPVDTYAEPTPRADTSAPIAEPASVDEADLASILGSLETIDSGTDEPEAVASEMAVPGDAAGAAAEPPVDADTPPGLAELGELQSKISQLLASFPATLDEAAPATTQPEPAAEVPAAASTPAPLACPSEPEPAAQPELPIHPEPETAAADALDEAAVDGVRTATDLTPPSESPDDPGFAGPAELTPEQMAAMMNDMGDPGLGGASEFVASEWGSFPVQITPEQVENLQFMVADAKAGIEQMATNITNLAHFGTRDEACTSLAETTASIQKICNSFEFASLRSLSTLMHDVATSAATVSDALMPELLVRASGIHSLIEQHVRGLECGMEMRWPLATLVHRTKRLLAGLNVHPLIRGWHKGDVFSLLELDGVSEGAEPPPKPENEDDFVETGVIAATPTPAMPTQAEAAAAASAPGAKKSDAESIIRVNASTIDGMLELISQLVLSKNRVFNLSRVLRLPGDQNARLDELATAADELAMLTANLQLTMMQARMQPTSKLFERYDRVVRDLAGLADKKVNLVTGGQNAMIDKNMFDGLGEALAQLLRSIVTKQVRKADQRTAEGRPETATITLDAQSQGSQIIISIEHDGDAPDRAAIASVAIAKGLQTAEGLDTLSDNDLFLLPFELDYGDTQLSSVGQNIQKLGGTITIRVTDAGLTRIEIALPLSVAIVAAILVGIGTESYAIPLQSVEEIIRVSDFQCSMINNRPVIRLREDVLDIVEASSIVGSVPAAESQAPAADSTHPNDGAPVGHDTTHAASQATATATATATAEAPGRGEFGVLLSSGVSRAVLTVDRIIGKQEIVIKKLTGSLAHNRHFAGATIRNDGGISLIFEVAELLRINR